MTAVNWFCLVLAFAFSKMYVCIKVDPIGIPNGNYTTIALNSHTMQPYTKSTIVSHETNNFTLLGNSELSASERTRRLIPYMAFYVPVSELPINKQYVSKNHIYTTKQLTRPSGTGGVTGPTGSHIPIPPQYVHNGGQYSLPAPSAASSTSGGQQYYQPNAGLSIYHTPGYGGQYPHPHPQQQQFHLLPPTTTGHSQLPGPSAAALPSLVSHVKGGIGNNHNAFVTYHKEVNPIRQKTVQYFPPLSSTASLVSSSSSASASDSPFENIRQKSSITKQQHKLHHHHHHSGSGSGTSGVAYRSRTKQSKINLTPFSPSNIVPGNFVPIVYTPVNNNNNGNSNSNNNNYNNNILNSHNAGGEEIDNSSFNQDGNEQYHKQQQQQQQEHHHHHQQPPQIALEYSSGPLTPSESTAAIPHDMTLRQPYNQPQQQQQHNPQEQSQYYSVTTSPVNIDLPHVVGGGATVGSTIASGDSVNTPAHRQHHNTEAISSPIIYHQNQHQHHHQHQQLQSDRVIIDASLQTSQQPQSVAVIGSQQQQQLLHVGESAIHFQPPKPEKFFESDVQQNQHQHHQQQQQHNIEQVLKDVNSNSKQNSQMMLTPQEKYVMYLQQRINYNKHQQQRHHATRHKEHEQQQQYIKQNQQQNAAQIFVLSSTMSPTAHDGTITALAPIRPSQPPIHYDSNYPQHSPIHHDLYRRPDDMKPSPKGGGGSNGDEVEEQILTIPVHKLFGEMETLQQQQQQQQKYLYSQSHSASPSFKHKSQYNSKNEPTKPQYIDYLIDEPKQSLDDGQQQQQHQKQQHQSQQNPQNQQQLELLKPTLGPPTHAFILVTTAAPFQQESVTQESYGSSVRPPYESKPKIRLQPLVLDKNVNYPIIREQNLTERPHVVSITPTTAKSQFNHYNNNNADDDADEKPKYVYVKQEFGQKLPAVPGDEAVKLKPLNKYESDDNQIPQQRHHQYQQQQQQHHNDLSLAPKLTATTTQHYQHRHHNEVQANNNAPLMPPKTILSDTNELPDIRTSSLAEILHKLQESNHLPHTLTPDNIDNSIKTLIRILKNLKQTQTIVANPPQHHEVPANSHPSSPDYDYTTSSDEEDHRHTQPHDLSLLTPTGPNKHPGPSTGRAGIDYPNYAEIPQTSFDCSQQRYKGFFGDPETNCQVWHYCDLNGGKASFLCPNGTIFSQIALTCDWWFNVKCATTAQLYVLNERLYKYILPFTPKFPEDYSGPLVDKYLAMKFQEMEDKMRLDKEKTLQEQEAEAAAEAATEAELTVDTVSEDSKEDNHLEETTTLESDGNTIHVKSHSSTKQHKPESVNSQVSEQSSERNLLIDDEVNDISQRGTVDNFESTTIATMTVTKQPDPISFSLKPIIVSSTLGPDYDDDHLQRHENEKRSQEIAVEDKDTAKSDPAKINGDGVVGTDKTILSTSSPHKMQVTVEKLNVIEIKPDGASGHLIRDMLQNSKETDQ